MWDKVPQKNNVSGNFCCAVFSVLDFLTLEAGTDRLSRNFGMELPFYTVISQKTTDLTLFGEQDLHLVLHGPVHSGPFCCCLISALQTQIEDDLPCLRAKFKGKTLSCIQVNTVLYRICYLASH
jgi:hypothetical protein